MTFGEAAALITAAAAMIAAIGSIFSIGLVIRAGRKIDRTDAKVDEIHTATNSMKDELVKATAKASRAEGRDEERANPTGQVRP